MSTTISSPSSALADAYSTVRSFSHQLCKPLAVEDYVIQSMPDASPTKWHLAHTSWFFETFVLKSVRPDYRSLHPQYDFLFNSYYNAVGERHCRPKRGLLSRPTVAEVYAYREYVDGHMLEWLKTASVEQVKAVAAIVELGLNHEQQHQELIVTDLKHALMENPLDVVFHSGSPDPAEPLPPLSWVRFEEGVYQVGYEGPGFSFDNEGPVHKQFLAGFELATRPVSNGEFLEFMQSGGYREPRWWLSAGFSWVQAQGLEAPLYWVHTPEGWVQRGLAGRQPVVLEEPVCHISYFEADAYARWAGARLPSEAEWEVAARTVALEGNFAESLRLRPCARSGQGLIQMFGDVWEWTQSSYSAYPGYAPAEGALGEYNGKFMCNQYVLRGGSCATPQSHIRASYRNFFPADARWQFSGLRLARGPRFDG